MIVLLFRENDTPDSCRTCTAHNDSCGCRARPCRRRTPDEDHACVQAGDGTGHPFMVIGTELALVKIPRRIDAGGYARRVTEACRSVTSRDECHPHVLDGST